MKELKKKQNIYAMLCARLMLMALLMTCELAFADLASVTSGVVNSANNIESILDELKEENKAILKQTYILNEELNRGILNIEGYEKKLNNLNVILEQQKSYLTYIGDDYKKYKENANKYYFSTRAKKYFPYIYMLAALSISPNGVDNKALYALAGYGAGAFVEGSGYGLAGLTTYIAFNFNFLM